MEPKSNSLVKGAMTSGLILGLALIVFSVVLYILGIYKPPTWVGILNYVLIIGGIFYGQKKFRDDELGGYISYGKALGTGVLVALFASIIYGVYFYLLTAVIDPGYIDQIYAATEEALLEKGNSEDQVEQMLDVAKQYMTPIMLLVSSVIGFVFWGTIFALITSIFVKKNEPMFLGTTETKEE
ncbi:MAG TPA: DUF4199 domain-containing protein [Tenuifilaceae bacterium]|nr:DUF4199 domain-containing protein [Tenuifilaceae bacterium]HQB78677.1 DUF4199 domain-containing protein [Tenuifilaceae bacterium]